MNLTLTLRRIFVGAAVGGTFLFSMAVPSAAGASPYFSDTTSIFFSTNSFLLNAQGRASIERLARDVVAHQEKQIYILGYASVSGTAAWNMALSQKRAVAVRSVLLGDLRVLGRTTVHVACVGLGATAFLPPDNSASNRRVDIVASS